MHTTLVKASIDFHDMKTKASRIGGSMEGASGFGVAGLIHLLGSTRDCIIVCKENLTKHEH